MWTDDKQRRLDDLQRRAQHSSLSVDDQQILDQLLSELVQVEWAALRPALSRLRHKQGQLQTDLGGLQSQNAVLSALAERYADLLAGATVLLAGLVSERVERAGRSRRATLRRGHFRV